MKTSTPRYELLEETDAHNLAECHVAGVTYSKRQNWLNWIANLERKGRAQDIRLTLHREPKNSEDTNAIRVCAQEMKLTSYGNRRPTNKRVDCGYLPASLAAILAPAMDNGSWVTIEDWHTVGRASKQSKLGMVLRLSWK